jgi:DMSO/TMAO reductase YedYZ molybdopterin-dependent catalytic subunit
MGVKKHLIESKMRKAEAARLSADKRPVGEIQGSGPPNRHGMPTLPPGQREVQKWPVLDLGIQPEITQGSWALAVDGECANPFSLDWEAFQSLPQVEDTSDFHCVTTWSRMDNHWQGVRFSALAERAQPSSEARYVYVTGYDGYSTNLELAECLDEDVLIVHTWEGEPLTREHGGPVRMIVPKKYAWKGSKWIKSISFLTEDRKGFWEVRGYSNTAEPWYNDRFSD